MWSVRTSGAELRDSSRGFTLVELMLSVLILALVVLAATTFIINSLKTNQHLEAQSDSATYANATLSQIRWKLTSSRKLLDRSAGGEAYLEMIDLGAAPPVIEGSRLPLVVPDAPLPASPNAVGNSLLLAEILEPFTEPETGRRVDRYRFVYYYLSPRAVTQLGPFKEVLDLIRWESVVYADFTQLDSLDEETAAKVATALRAARIEYVWDVDAPPEAAFSALSYTGLVKPPEPTHTIHWSRHTHAVDGIGVGQASTGLRVLSVARNSGPDFSIATPVPFYGQGEEGFPGGFEVVVGGPTRGRKVVLRLVLASWAGGRLYSRDAQLLVAVSD